MVDTCRRMNATGLNQGTSGNLSTRSGDGVLITPTSLPDDAMEPSDHVPMRFDGGHGGTGARRPNGASTATSSCGAATSRPCCTPIRSMPPRLPAPRDPGRPRHGGSGGRPDDPLRALRHPGPVGSRACLLGQHGMIALGAWPAAALALAVEVETLAPLYLQALVLGEPPVLPDDEIARVPEQMRGLGYGGTA